MIKIDFECKITKMGLNICIWN